MASSSSRTSVPVNAHLVWPIVIRPFLCKIQKRDQKATFTLLKALGNAENSEPGFLLELVNIIVASSHQYNQSTVPPSINMTESLLRLQANIPEMEEQRCRR